MGEWFRLLAARLVAVVALTVAPVLPPAIAQDLPGAPIHGVGVAVQDGDTFDLADQHGQVIRIRIHGIDAPELDQACMVRRRAVACGEDAADRLHALIMSQPLVCRPKGVSFNRIAAECVVGDKDLGALMVREGHAIASRRYSVAYTELEEEAREERLGIWRGTMETPSCHRRPRGAGCPCPIQRCIMD
jgi:endonuclease YncB( thermonuclease family)